MNTEEKKKKQEHRRKDREARAFFRCFIFLMTAEKTKSTDLYSFSFLIFGEAHEMRGSKMKALMG